ncbi:dihydrofolate reductase [Salinibius halmophilus]|uniref:dihydrofolate reductase n=1 Tax=Salinibius halmophilus TaxID=1853216 RepID=UPI000E65FE2F|nr:dihydrofolate reductase [Salinibius halmophilus]
MQIAMIWAMANNGVIGKGNQLPWHLPEDLQHFKAKTTGKPVIMGRKTFESIGRPLPNRENIVITRDPHWHHEGVEVFHDTQSAVSYANSLLTGAGEIIVMGGGQIYQALLPLANRLYITKVDVDIDGDAYAPEVDWAQWTEIENETHTSKNGMRYRICEYKRS